MWFNRDSPDRVPNRRRLLIGRTSSLPFTLHLENASRQRMEKAVIGAQLL